ncbi:MULTISPECIES: ABC transporter ATP-binding protein [unclassified Leifsonia]|uniref:ABC transporter ATP-binding protein n=1 Tax=unclassified Leifsonia TaxID=2663824 RepID=UPI000B7C58C3|nr:MULTISPECIES: ABC transporter ATP-binding protein [unclassified Leifsonia]
MVEAILSAKGLSKTYGTGESRFEALRGVDLDIAPGESVAIVGRSGSGKSTLMHLLALLDRPDDGEMLIDGRPASHLGRRELDNLRNERFGFVFQQFFLIPNLTVLENVTLPLAIRGVSRKERARRGMEVLERLDLADKAKNAATALSGGQKQRVVIARALVGDPSVIFADEPTGNLDSTTGAHVEDLLLSSRETDGITLVLVTHDDDLAARCDRRVTITDGRIAAEVAA